MKFRKKSDSLEEKDQWCLNVREKERENFMKKKHRKIDDANWEEIKKMLAFFQKRRMPNNGLREIERGGKCKI